MDTTQPILQTYRYTFSPDIIQQMKYFSNIHAYDDRETFKHAFQEWKEMNHDDIHNELIRLRQKGYNGDIYSKMYHSMRYYYRKTSNKTQTPRKRRTYIHIQKNILDLMDQHIHDVYRSHNMKPSDAYDLFMELYQDIIEREVHSIMTRATISKEDSIYKIKKTYKNRYFMFKISEIKTHE